MPCKAEWLATGTPGSGVTAWGERGRSRTGDQDSWSVSRKRPSGDDLGKKARCVTTKMKKQELISVLLATPGRYIGRGNQIWADRRISAHETALLTGAIDGIVGRNKIWERGGWIGPEKGACWSASSFSVTAGKKSKKQMQNAEQRRFAARHDRRSQNAPSRRIHRLPASPDGVARPQRPGSFHVFRQPAAQA
jgi:hypothetical protein